MRAVQPCFVLDQDLLQGAGQGIAGFAARVRRYWPRSMVCAPDRRAAWRRGAISTPMRCCPGRQWRCLAPAIAALAELNAPLIVLKEFPARYRDALACFLRAGFTCVPSMPTTSVSIAYPSFDDYMSRALSSKTRKDLRKKFRAAEKSAPIAMSAIADIGTVIDDVYPLTCGSTSARSCASKSSPGTISAGCHARCRTRCGFSCGARTAGSSRSRCA